MKPHGSHLDRNLARLLLRTGPFVLARPDIGVSPLPGGQEVAASHWFSEKKGGEPFLVTSFRVATLGGLVRMWENIPFLACPECGGNAVLVAFGGSFLSGAGKFATWFCPSCGQDFDAPPRCGVAQLGETLEEAAAAPTFVRPPSDTKTAVLPGGLEPEALRGVFDGALLEAYAMCAVNVLKAIDEEVSTAVADGRAFRGSFHLDAGEGIEGELVFDNVAGFGQIFLPDGDRPVASVPVQWDDYFGLWPTLYAAREKMATIRRKGKKQTAG